MNEKQKEDSRTTFLVSICAIIFALGFSALLLYFVQQKYVEGEARKEKIIDIREKEQERIPVKYKSEKHNDIKMQCVGDMLYFTRNTASAGQVYDYNENLKRVAPVECLPKEQLKQ